MNRVPRWRIAAAVAVLAGLVGFLALFAPIYSRNLELQRYVSEPDTDVWKIRRNPTTCYATWVLDKAHQLNLPVTADNVHILRSAERAAHRCPVLRAGGSCPGIRWICISIPGAGSR